MIEKIGHYSLENIPSIYDEEAMTALELAGRTAHKVNEVIEDQNQLHKETQDTMEQVGNRLDQQDQAITKIREETVPEEVAQEMELRIIDGTFNKAISEYANELEARLDNMLSNVPEGSTTMDAEVIDIRVDELGHSHESAGASVREQSKRIKTQAESMVNNMGVYTIPMSWSFIKGTGRFESRPFKIPEHGFTARVSEEAHTVDGNSTNIILRIYLGTMVNGSFVKDDDLTSRYTSGVYTNKLHYIPYMEGVYATVHCIPMNSSNTSALSDSNYAQHTDILDQVRIYTGKVHNGGNLLGTNLATFRGGNGPNGDVVWGINGLIYKFTALSSPLPLKFVDRVVCNPNVWMCAKIYKFDPVTRTTTYNKTVHFNRQHPCFGSECVIDFSEYGDNYYAILLMGYVPTFPEYASTGYNGGTSGTTGATKVGLDVSAISNGVHVSWVNETALRRVLTGGNRTVQKNVELLKTLKHKTVPAKYGREDANYILGQDDFAGVFYGGAYAGGAFFYHISPETYFTALLNPNSNAYGDSDTSLSGLRYGLACSGTASLMHGYPIPLSVFDMRYNWTIPYFKAEPLSLATDLHKLKAYDLITQGYGGTGHTVMLTGITNIGDMGTALHIIESATPSFKESVWPLHNGLPYIKSAPEDWYTDAYDFMQITDPAYDQPLHDKAVWTVPYTEPQKVMCSRGYNSIYLAGVNQVQLSIDPDVTEIYLTRDGVDIGTIVVGDMEPEVKNLYNVINITDKVGVGTIRVRNNLDDGVEVFHVLDVSGYTVNASVEGDNIVITTNRPEQAKIVNVSYKLEDGSFAGDVCGMNFVPDFDATGKMVLPDKLATSIGNASVTYAENWLDHINVIFKTEHDTNTFGVDAEGDAYL